MGDVLHSGGTVEEQRAIAKEGRKRRDRAVFIIKILYWVATMLPKGVI